MKQFKRSVYLAFILGIIFSILNNSYGQVITNTKQYKFDVQNNVAIELNSKYTNIEFEPTDNNSVVIEATMEIEGLSESEADTYFQQWELKVDEKNNKLVINSFLHNNAKKNLEKNGFYKGYFINSSELEEITSDAELIKIINPTGNVLNENKGDFDFDAYIEEGDDYLLKWQKINNEPIGKRWFNKTKDERIQLKKSIKDKQPNKANRETHQSKNLIDPKEKIVAKANKNTLPKGNVRALPKRAIINKTLKIKIPRTALLHINVRHGKVVFSDEITNLKADLSYVLLQATKINGSHTSIKGAYTNLEVNHWNSGNLESLFSDYILIKEATNISISSNASIVSIDKVTNNINATGNFKMLSVDFSSSIKQAKIDVVDSKKVWVKLPNTPQNLRYKGVDSKLIHPEKFTLKTDQNNASNQYLENMPLNNNEKIIDILALGSVMQIYDTPWEDLEIKSLEKL